MTTATETKPVIKSSLLRETSVGFLHGNLYAVGGFFSLLSLAAAGIGALALGPIIGLGIASLGLAAATVVACGYSVYKTLKYLDKKISQKINPALYSETPPVRGRLAKLTYCTALAAGAVFSASPLYYAATYDSSSSPATSFKHTEKKRERPAHAAPLKDGWDKLQKYSNPGHGYRL